MEDLKWREKGARGNWREEKQEMERERSERQLERGETGNGEKKKREGERRMEENTVCVHYTLSGSISRDWSKLTRLWIVSPSELFAYS